MSPLLIGLMLQPKKSAKNLLGLSSATRIDYKKQAFENDMVTVETWVGEPTRISWERFTEITRGEDLLVKARSVWCLIDRETSKPTRITADMIELF